jgi:hypothetical protein
MYRTTRTRLLGIWTGLILQGQIWRLVTFLIVPESLSLIWFAVALFSIIFWAHHGAEWGTAKFTLFYLTGAVLTAVAGFIGGLFLALPVYVFYTIAPWAA